MKLTIPKINWKGLLFWSNQFYGLCAVLLTVESSVKILHAIPPLSVLVLIHYVTVIYYTHAYIMENKDGIYNDRSLWYVNNKKYIYYSQVLYTLLCFFIVILQCKLLSLLANSSLLLWTLLFITMLFSLFYYKPTLAPKKKNIIRSFGMIKSISIAWVWAITCCLVPIWITADYEVILSHLPFWLHFIQLFIFIFILAVLFDIKDIGRDQLEQINTIAVKIGKHEIASRIVIPALVIYTILILLEWHILHASFLFVLVQLLLVILIYKVSKFILDIPSILKNILLIDGLMIIKAILSTLILWK